VSVTRKPHPLPALVLLGLALGGILLLPSPSLLRTIALGSGDVPEEYIIILEMQGAEQTMLFGPEMYEGLVDGYRVWFSPSHENWYNESIANTLYEFQSESDAEQYLTSQPWYLIAHKMDWGPGVTVYQSQVPGQAAVKLRYGNAVSEINVISVDGEPMDQAVELAYLVLKRLQHSRPGRRGFQQSHNSLQDSPAG
jgi:hypothetical protein